MIKRKSVSFSIDEELLKRFEDFIKEKKYKTKSMAITDIIRNEIIKKEYVSGKDVFGVITILYHHHRRDLKSRLTDVQHSRHKMILSTLHIHLDEENCLEVIVVKGDGKDIEELMDNIRNIKGVKHCSLSITRIL